ncbi:hypothetical protein ACUY3S_05170 [Corynebacterium resistens]
MKTVSIIGPDGQRVRAVGEQLEHLSSSIALPGREFHVLVGAGPESRPDCVVAVAGEPTADNLRVVKAVIGAMGVVVLLPDAHGTAWPDIPGALRVSSVEEVAKVIRSLRVDMKRWFADAHRADAERLDRVRISVRLAGGRLSKECAQFEDVDAAHATFVAGLRHAVVRHGVRFPSVPLAPPEPPRGSGEAVSRLETWLPLVGALGAVAMGAGIGRAIGHVTIGLAMGILVAVVVVALRLKLHREHSARLRNGEVQQALQQHWAELVTQVVARLQMPRVTEQLRKLETTGIGAAR